MTRQDLQLPETINGAKNGAMVHCLFLFIIFILVCFLNLQEIKKMIVVVQSHEQRSIVGQKLDKNRMWTIS